MAFPGLSRLPRRRQRPGLHSHLPPPDASRDPPSSRLPPAEPGHVSAAIASIHSPYLGAPIPDPKFWAGYTTDGCAAVTSSHRAARDSTRSLSLVTVTLPTGPLTRQALYRWPRMLGRRRRGIGSGIGGCLIGPSLSTGHGDTQHGNPCTPTAADRPTPPSGGHIADTAACEHRPRKRSAQASQPS
jgi:hypothetical protein